MNHIKYILVTISYILMLLQSISCQFNSFPNLFDEFPPSIKAARDPRENRGPVVFPQAPIPPDTSGVRIGASGFGFVPPSGGRGPVLGALGGGPNAENNFPFW